MSVDRRMDRGESNPHRSTQLPARLPPHNLEAERSVLCSILLRPEVCDDLIPLLTPEDFYDEAHRRLYQHLVRMHDAGKQIDVTLLIDELRRSGDLDRVGGAPFVANLNTATGTSGHVGHYARIVQHDGTRRSLIHACTDILQSAYYGQEEAKDLLSHAEQKVFAILENRHSSTVKGIDEVLHEAMDRIDARMKGEHVASGVDTGFTEFDNLTGGLHNSELVILAARPSMGKTALAMNIAEHVAFKEQQPVLFVSLEMSAIELVDRMLCSVAEVNGARLRNGTLSKEDRKRLVDSAAEMSKAPLFIDDSPARTVSEIAAAARRLKRQHADREKDENDPGRLGLVVIDYLQLIEPDNPSDPRQEQVAKMARRLKGLARELKVPVLCLAQLNRQAEVAKENRPRLSHLRESGAIEQDADVVMFVHREEYYRTGEDREQYAGQAEIIVAKQRNGPIGEVELVWRKEYTRFSNPAPQHYEEFEDYRAEF